MLNRLIQLYRMPGAMNVLKEYIERRDVLMVIQAIPLFMAMLNLLTCFMVFYSVDIYYTESHDGYEWHIEPYQDRGGSWMVLFKDTFRFNLTSTPWNMHLATYFWVVYECSATGYGVFNPSNHALMQILFIGMASSAMITTYYSVRIISIRANVNKSLAGFKQHMKDIKEYMARENLDPELRKEIRRYYEYNWEKMGGIDYRGVLKLCDQITLRTDAILDIYGPTFAKCPILANADVSLLRIIGRAVRSVYFLRDMTIIEHNDIVSDMYFVDYGGVEVSVAKGDMNSVLRLPRGSVFGNLEGTPAHRSPYTVVATSRLHLLMIKSQAFFTVTKDFPAVKELLINARMGFKGMRMYILGSEATVVKMHRDGRKVPPPQSKFSMLKYIYFQEGLVQFYLIAICLSCIYLDLYNAGYEDNRSWLLATLYSLDVVFLMKILSQHSLPFLVTNKNLKRIMLPIRRLYFKEEFRYDLISVLPLEALSFAAPKNSQWMWFAWLRLNRTFRIATVYKCLNMRKESITINLTLITALAAFIWFSLFVHTCTCIWYFIATVEDTLQPNSSWIHLDDGNTHCDNYYICSLYFVITTFTQNGVGDIMPKKHSEAFMKNNRVSQNLVTIVNKYTLHLWRENRGLQMPHFLISAPLSLRLRVMSAAYMHHITRHHIFEHCDPAFLRQLCGCLILYTYNEGMYVVKESEITDSMYLIHTGKVMETSEDQVEVTRVYPAGSYFGILQGLLRNTPYTCSYQTVIKSQVLTLKLDDWEYLLQHFPSAKEIIHKKIGKLDDTLTSNNWPGGSPTVTPQPPESEPPLETQDAAPGTSQYPRSERQFNQVSTAKEAYTPVSETESRNQDYIEPTDNKKFGEFSVPKTKSDEKSQSVDQIAIEGKTKYNFFGRIASTAKKLMGRVSDADLSSADGKDELLLEEDVEATEVLLAQFEKARKKEMEERRLKSRRKSSFVHEEELEKHMFSLGLHESTTQLERIDSDILLLQPLQLRDEQEEMQNLDHASMPENSNPKEISNSTVDLSHNILVDDDTKIASKFVPLTSSKQLYSPTASAVAIAQHSQLTEAHPSTDIPGTTSLSPSMPLKFSYRGSESVRDPQSTGIADSQPAANVTEATTSEVSLEIIKIFSEAGMVSSLESVMISNQGEVAIDKSPRIDTTEPPVETPPLLRQPRISLAIDVENKRSKGTIAERNTASDSDVESRALLGTTDEGPSKYDDILSPTMVPPGDDDPSHSKRSTSKDENSEISTTQVHVRYEDERVTKEENQEKEIVELQPPRAVTLDSDEPFYTRTASDLKQSDEEEASTSENKKDKKPYKRETMD